MATADKLNRLKQTKADLKAALIEKGQTPGDVFADYPAKVRAIETGGGEQATPEIAVDENGLITATAGDKTATKQLSTQSGKTITPGPIEQIAVAAGKYVTGDVIVAVVREDQMDIAKQLDEIVDGNITEISSTATNVRIYAFKNCARLTTANFPVATNIDREAFNGCTALTTVNFPAAIRVSNSAFSSCSNLTTADFPAAISIGDNAFYSCTKLAALNFPVATSIGSYAFHSCKALTTVDFPEVASISMYAFYGCSVLTTADFPAATSIGSSVFSSCSKLTALILRSETMCTLSGTNAFTSTPIKSGGTGYIYVPRALVDSYKAESNWSTYATQFRALEDYTVDGTITGALDSTKI